MKELIKSEFISVIDKLLKNGSFGGLGTSNFDDLIRNMAELFSDDVTFDVRGDIVEITPTTKDATDYINSLIEKSEFDEDTIKFTGASITMRTDNPIYLQLLLKYS